MNIQHLLTILVVTLTLCVLTVSTTVVAKPNSVSNCGENVTIEDKGFGLINDAKLKSLIAEEEKQLLGAIRYHNRGYRWSYMSRIKQKVNRLNAAQQALTDKMYLSGCSEEKKQASVKARVEELENTISTSK